MEALFQSYIMFIFVKYVICKDVLILDHGMLGDDFIQPPVFRLTSKQIPN